MFFKFFFENNKKNSVCVDIINLLGILFCGIGMIYEKGMMYYLFLEDEDRRLKKTRADEIVLAL
jgi:hypothetical protein